MLSRIHAGFVAALGKPMAAADLAHRVIAGIEQDAFLILTHPEFNGEVRARLATVDRATRDAA